MKMYRRFINLPIEIETENSQIYLNIKDVPVKHLPERLAPYCRDPSHPAYSDPGDPEENEFEDINELISIINNEFEEEIKLLKIKLQETITNLNSDTIIPLLK